MKKVANRYRRERLTIVALEFIVLVLFWVILSGRFQVKYVTLGVISAGLVTFLTRDLVLSVFPHEAERDSRFFLRIGRFLAYLPWLLSRIVIANLQVAYLVLHPRMPIAPALLQFRTGLKRNLARVIVANSITLTPGTITVSLKDGRYIVHALVPPSASDITEATLQNKVGEIFMEEREEPPASHWAYSIEELEE
ncbi:MAG: Na+/H+ antiporter subunit E [Chloroflexi bacterium]|nr:Na+/H+ antiporter subunit E [Chloroflexota bacterium]